MNTILRVAAVSVAVAAISACGGAEKTPAGESTAAAGGAPAAAPATAPSGPQTPGPGGKVITVEAISDASGNYFKPNEIEAHKGDVIRYTLKVGVHNVHFLPDSNPGKSGYPTAPSDMLQLPGQTYDVLVNFPAGKYYFQCDPHAALGMHGHVTVE